MERRDDWIHELERRQDNIDTIWRIPNAALFQGTLINGNLHLNRIQRAGALFLGLSGLATSCFLVASALAELRDGHFPDLGYALFVPLSLWSGITKNALVNDPAKARRKSPEHPTRPT